MDNQSKIEELGNLIYATLKGDEVTANISERAYITDILSEAIIGAGYVKLADDQSLPPVECPEHGINLQPNLCEACGYEAMRCKGREDMLKAGSRRVEL